MAFIEREFFRSASGPSAADEDVWFLVYDQETRGLFVRHDWQVMGRNGAEAFDVDEFLQEPGTPQEALIDALFLLREDA